MQEENLIPESLMQREDTPVPHIKQRRKPVRSRNSNSRGGNWTQSDIIAVWNKGTIIPGYDPNQFRKDSCSAWMQFSKYGDTTVSGYGWEIDHIKPVSAGGTDHITNLQPLQWENNRGKGDDWPYWNCAIKAAA